MARARAALEQLRELRDQVAPGEPVPLTLLATVPDLFSSTGHQLRDERARAAVLAATEAACVEVSAMRAREGAVLAADLAGRLASLVALVEQVEQRGPRVIEAARLRLRERVARLIEPGVALDHTRLEHEVALLADRADVAEECTRLRGHVAEVRRVLTEQGEARGKRLDFLCQELGREANTLGQKSADAEIAERASSAAIAAEMHAANASHSGRRSPNAPPSHGDSRRAATQAAHSPMVMAQIAKPSRIASIAGPSHAASIRTVLPSGQLALTSAAPSASACQAQY